MSRDENEHKFVQIKWEVLRGLAEIYAQNGKVVLHWFQDFHLNQLENWRLFLALIFDRLLAGARKWILFVSSSDKINVQTWWFEIKCETKKNTQANGVWYILFSIIDRYRKLGGLKIDIFIFNCQTFSFQNSSFFHFQNFLDCSTSKSFWIMWTKHPKI